MPLIGNGIGVPFGKKGGGGDAFAIERSIHFDGVNRHRNEQCLVSSWQALQDKCEI